MSNVVTIKNNQKSVVTLNPNKYGKPDIASSPDNLASLTKRSEQAMNEARKSADKVIELVNNIGYGGFVKEVKESKGTVTINKVNGETNSFKVVKTVNGIASDEVGNIELPNQIIVKFLD